MTNAFEHYKSQRQALIDAGAYDPAHERDACGVGVVCSIDGTPRRDVVELAVKALKALFHRGAVDADGKSGDGAGIMIGIPQDFFREQVKSIGQSLRDGPVLVGQIFLPRSDLGAQEAARTIVESEVLRSGFYLYGWRQAPVDVKQLGSRANSTRPEIEQIMMAAPEGWDADKIERELFLCRRRIEKAVDSSNLKDFYICSFSSKTLIYKGMFRAELVDDFYLDLKDPRLVSNVAVFHQRFSTNTFPEWRLAQPFRMLAHNGEINTLRGNVNWMKAHEIRMAATVFGDEAEGVKPVIQPGGSDSAALDNVYELLVRAGRSAPMAKALLIPEAWAKAAVSMPDSHRALYAYCNSVMEPWDGPAAICATDGRWVVAGKDRNGLRPLRVAETKDGLLIVGSEAGMTGVADDRIKRRLHIAPGRMIGVDMVEGKLFNEFEILDWLANKHQYTKWRDNMVELEPEIAPGPEPRKLFGEELKRRQIAAGLSMEDLDVVLDTMVKEGKEAIGSMGDDSPLAVLSDKWRPLAHYFRQNFAQVTNPPIDPLREASGMSLKTRFKNLGNILLESESQTDVFVLESPFLTNLMYERMRAFPNVGKVVNLDCTFAVPDEAHRAGQGLKAALDNLRDQAVAAVEGGASMLVLTDEDLGEARMGVPMILATSAVHSRLIQKGLRSFVSLIVRSSEALDPHAFAVMVGVGATAINPYLALEILQERLSQGRYEGLNEHKAFLNYKKSIEAGLMKILAKKGISVISSYRGGCEFEALGLSRALVAEYFPGISSRISGIGLAGIETKLKDLHQSAFATKQPVVNIGGFYKFRAAGETHYYQPKLIHLLQDATTRKDYETFKAYSKLVRSLAPTSPRDLLDWKPKYAPVALDEVESVNEIRKRFVTPGMSLGALSPEAHETLNIAMNRIGARSVSGEGGEDPERYQRRPNGDNPNSAIKQVASGRFGVTAEYLNQCREIEIKVAQGAKPGEGGQLPGFKVTEFIARMRHSTPGVGLISPPPHHDIYSIEDLAQLIYDLKQINPDARVTVKLVSQPGIGTVAAGVAKAKADAILVSGQVGGTGASPLTSIKFAGLPFELGLSEAHQVLTLNNLRGQIRLRTDGGIRTGRDVVVAAMLGAEEFGIGTASLVAIGCLMVRQCQSNTCPVGVCVQDERLRAKFTGTPEKVINLFTFIAEEVREILASLGLKSLEEAVGRVDLLAQISRGGAHLDDLDLNPLLVAVEMDKNATITPPDQINAVADTLDAKIVKDAAFLLERGEKMELSYEVRNTMRAVGTRTSSAMLRAHPKGLDEGHLKLELRGSAGQSLGAFAIKGLMINLVGEANDYVGKGLSGATIVVRPKVWAEDQALAGNTILYGATSGKLFVAGTVGERFAVRNSGASTVVEGAGAHACEYMTGGEVVILGLTGTNFGAGMTGGMAWVYDPDGVFAHYINPESITLRPVSDAREARLKALITEHLERTHSPRAQAILDDWDNARAAFVEVIPNEILAIETRKEAKSA